MKEEIRMELTWMGRYREFVERIVKFGNAYAQSYTVEKSFNTPIAFSSLQLQVMEYILENEEKNQNMLEIATRLGISASTFSKNVKKMMEKGLLEKYHISGNRKEVIVKVTELGREMYRLYSEYILREVFQPIFQELDALPDDVVGRFCRVLDLAKMGGERPVGSKANEQQKLIKIVDG